MPYGYGSANTGKSSSSSGGGGYQNIHQTGAITQTPGRKTWSPGVGGTQHIPKTKKTVTTGGASPFAYTRTPKGRTTTGGIEGQWANFLKHRMNTQIMKGMVPNNYAPTYTHALGGYDWKQNFPDSAEWADKGLAYGYQHLTEATKALMDPTTYGTGIFGLTQNLGNAFNKANVEAEKNIQGFTGETIPAETLEKYHDWQNLASGGLIDLYRYGGFI